jgi:magnesium transporter
MGGNVGVQSSAIVVQGLANKSLDLDSTWRKLGKEILIALMIGLAFALLTLTYSYFLSSNSLPLTLTVSSALFTVILFASVFGTFIPIILNRFNIDPALATGPFITTMNDILGMFIYLGIGRILYGVFA